MYQRTRQIRKEITALGFMGFLRLKCAAWRSRFLAEGALFRLHAPGVKVYCRAHTSDIVVFHQIFVDREYRCLDHVSEANLVIDCGANVGYSAAYFLARYGKARLIAVEPDPANFALLSRNVEVFKDRVTLLQRGVWSRTVGLVIANPTANAWAFMVREAHPGEVATIEAVDIPSLLRASGQERISILKVDIEGSELEVFKESPWLQKVDHLVIEIHGPECEAMVLRAVGGRAAPTQSEELTVFDLTGS
jgi:FkbM family methyltransferase